MASVIGGIIGNSAASGDQQNAQNALQQALANIQGVNTPSIAEQELALQNEKSAGQLNPNMEGTVSQGGTGLSNISVDPRLRNAQMQALTSLQQQGQSGLTATDRQALNQVLNQQQQQSNSANQAVLQNMAARGQGGSGATLAAQLANNQNASNNGLTRSLGVAAQAQQNALNATAQSGQLGSQLEGQQYGESANAANAQDAINRFNAQNSQQVMGTNTGAKNAAQQLNLQNAQNIANTNTGISNQQQQYNKGLYQQQYNNQMGKAQAEAGAEGNLGTYYGNQANATRGMWSGIGQGIDKAGIAAAGMAAGVPPGAMPSGSSPDSSSYGNKSYSGGSGNGYQASNQDWSNFTGGNKFNQGGEVAPKSDLGIFKYVNGGKVSGPEMVAGDSPANDVVDAKLSSQEIVVPKEIAQHDNDDVIMAFIKGVKTANKR